MATYGQAVRRGLPRVPGGEPWPRAGEVPAGVVATVPTAGRETGVDEVGPSADAVAALPLHVSPDLADAATAGSEVPPAATSEAIPQPLPSGPTAGAAPDAGTRPLRRGLPRVPGGEPWPPAGFVADKAVAGAGGADAIGAAAQTVAQPQPQPQPQPSAGAAAGARAVDAVEAAAVGSAAAAAGPRADGGADSAAAPPPAVGGAAGTPLRRGLPRVPGGEPWPAAGSAPSATPAVTAAPATVPVEATETAASAPARPATAAPAPVAAPAPAPAPVAAPASPAGDRAAASVAVSKGPRPPLPFTRTVWAGATAASRPPARPEPARIGPFTRMQWAGAIVVGGFGLLFAAAMAVFAVRALISFDAVRDFLQAYPGEYHLPDGAPVGLPAWLGWQHFFNTFLIVLIIRSGLQVRGEKRPSVFWSPRGNSKRKISLALWLHQALDILWIVNGVVFVVLLFVTGQWMRIVPTSWEVFPNAISAALQYVSLDWPTENGWVNYNSLQQIAYFTTVFIAAPLSIITGVRMSGIWPKDAKTLNRIYPVEWARAVHFPVMIYFVLFIFAHVVLVFATGALRNLNHMYASQDAVNWTGFWIFVASMVVVAAGWVAARPLVLAPIAGLFGTVKGR